MMDVSIVGAGSWGSAFSLHLAKRGIRSRLWVREIEILKDLRQEKENKIFLPGFRFPEGISFYGDLEEAVASTRIIFMAVPSQFCRGVFSRMVPFLTPGRLIVSLTKGIEEQSLKRMSEIMDEVCGAVHPRIAVMSGPSFAREVAQGHPTAVVVASRDKEAAENIQHLISDASFRVYSSDDVVGVELAGALKNVIALASGISDGLAFGNNSRAALITRGLAEITRLGKKLGARKETFYGLAGIGDLVLTCTARLSRNYTVGFEIGSGRRPEDVIKGMKMVAEGVSTALSVHNLALREQAEMPISEEVYQVLHHGKDPRQSLQDLMTRRLKEEIQNEA